MHSKYLPLLLIVTAAAAYGLLDSFATLPWYQALVAVAFIDGVQGLSLITYGWRRWPREGLLFRQVLLLVFFQGGSTVLFLSVIKIAPIGPVVGIFMAAPIFYLLHDLFKGKRSLGGQEVFLFLLLLAGIILAAASPREDGGDSFLGIGLALIASLGNAYAMALVSRWNKQGDMRFFAGVRSCILALCLLPAVVVFAPTLNEALSYSAMGLIAAPATAGVWWAVGRLHNTLWSAAALSQAIWASLWSFFLWQYSISLYAGLSALLIIAAVFIEQRRSHRLILEMR